MPTQTVNRMTEVEAYNTLHKIDEGYEDTTIIDDVWWDSFYENWQTLEALLVLTGCRHYKEVVDKYEGWSVDELLTAYITHNLKSE